MTGCKQFWQVGIFCWFYTKIIVISWTCLRACARAKYTCWINILDKPKVIKKNKRLDVTGHLQKTPQQKLKKELYPWYLLFMGNLKNLTSLNFSTVLEARNNSCITYRQCFRKSASIYALMEFNTCVRDVKMVQLSLPFRSSLLSLN